VGTANPGRGGRARWRSSSAERTGDSPTRPWTDATGGLIPTDPDYSSLNLAQACLLVAYELFLAADASEGDLPQGKRYTRSATREEMEQMFQALEGGLARIDFFNARSPESVMRIFRTLLSRAEPERQEAGLVAAVGFEIQNYLDRHLGRIR
jgi:tRNA/rRNA methyltransferase